jgi:hypothetical protein
LLGKSRKKVNSVDYYAPYVIKGIGSGKAFFAGGIDPYQAVQLAFRMINAELYYLKEGYNVELSWEGDDTGGLGFDS